MIDDKIKNLNIQVAKLKLVKAKIKSDKAVENRRQAEDAVDTAERSGSDTSELETRLNAATKAESEATKGVSAANDNLKAVQKGGSVN